MTLCKFLDFCNKGMDSDELSDSIGEDNDSGDENSVEKCCFGSAVFNVPVEFCSEEEIFNEVLSIDIWENVLSMKQRQWLKTFLPSFPQNDEEEKAETVRSLLCGENFNFSSPKAQFFVRLRDGYLSPLVVETERALKKATYREYKNQQYRYFYRLLRDVLISRKKLLDAAYLLPPDESVKMQQFTAKPKDATLSERTRLRYFSVLQDTREECCDLDTSSEDENYPESSPPKITRKHKKQMQIIEASLSPEMTRITSTTALPPGYPGSSYFINRCLDMIEVTEERYREMLQTHKQRKMTDPSHPELDISKVDLTDMISRTNLPKRPLGKLETQTKKKTKSQIPQDAAEKAPKLLTIESEKKCSESKVCPTVIQNCVPTNEQVFPPINCIERVTETNVGKIVEVERKLITQISTHEEPITSNKLLQTVPETRPYPACFFSLIKELLCESGEQKMSAMKLEEKVRIWQDSAAAQCYDWFFYQECWSDLVSSALRFLAGDLISIVPENFVPFLDYKEKQQQWQWIGIGRDSDEQMCPLCAHWLENKDDVAFDILETSQGSPPPPRITTVWTVRAATDEEKNIYKEQEHIRYQNPQKAFTFRIHGYEAVVGPVKGVYGKESAVNKAREHSLLISDRPAFVTILSLVRDSAARLPNGEGTRADICELLKDSQYLAPANDQQIHTVVSGALDRLHYEKDPCVKYDVNRKLWIYLHRNRTEEEFERIHQAQAAAAKARKAVQKNKPPRPKNKDVSRITPTPNVSVMSESVAALLNIDVSTTISPTATSQSPRGGCSPRTQGSPKQSHPGIGRHAVRALPLQTQVKNSQAHNSLGVARKIEFTSVNTIASTLGSSPVFTTTPTSNQQHSVTHNILTQFHTDGGNSRPPSQGSVQSLPSPKTVIANVNAAQFVGVGSLQIGSSGEQTASSSAMAPCIGVLSVDMKPSSPSFVGQPPVLQPVLSHQAVSTTTKMPCVSSPLTFSTSPNIPKTKLISTSSIPGAKAIPGFHTIVIKPDTPVRPGTGISSLPVLSVEDITASTDSPSIQNNPVVARLLQGSHLLSLSSIMQGATQSTIQKQNSRPTQIFKSHGTNLNPQQNLSSPNVNLFPTTHLPSTSDAKLPRLAFVSHEAANAPNATIVSSAVGQQSAFPVSKSSTLSSAEAKQSMPIHRDYSDIKRISVPSHALGSARQAVSDFSQLLECTVPPNRVISSTASPSSCASQIPTGKASASPSSIVIGTHESIKQLGSTYVMTAPLANPSMITAQHGIRSATTPLNMRTLQGIKVIPVPQNLAGGKSIRGTPLLARIIAPSSSGVTLRSAIPSDLIHPTVTHQVKSGASTMNLVHGLHNLPPSSSPSHILRTTSPHPSGANQEVPSSQPFIIQVQAPKTPEGENL